MMQSDSNYPCELKELHKPDLTAVSTALNKGLQKNFKEVTVTVEDCPDLTKQPWTLASPGICGEAKLIDCGGVPYLVPTPQKEKIYNFDKIASDIGNKDLFFIGAGAGGYHLLDGRNSEMMANLKVGTNENVQTHVAVDKENGCDLLKFPGKEFALLGNFLATKGLPGKVLKVHVKTRTGEDNFVKSIQNILLESYPNEMVGLGGVFVMKTGKAQLHVMPCFSETPLKTDEDVNNWLQFYEMSAPLICLSVFYNQDKGMDVRVEHTHCFSHHGEGGHYHHDTTPVQVEYEGYFTIADQLCRIDRPKHTHDIGRD